MFYQNVVKFIKICLHFICLSSKYSLELKHAGFGTGIDMVN